MLLISENSLIVLNPIFFCLVKIKISNFLNFFLAIFANFLPEEP